MHGLESRLNAIWYAGAPVPWILRMLSGVHALLMSFRRPVETDALPVPVVVVGNFTAGGTGKTPVIIALVDYLKSAGYTPGVISRGYGRSGSGPVSVEFDSHALKTGDEPLLISRRCMVPVRVDAKRRRAAEYLAASGCSVIVSDDGLQHRALPRTLEIEIIDASRGYGNGRLLPAGPLRERPRSVGMRISNGQTTDTEDAFGMQLQPVHCRNLLSGETRALADFAGSTVNAVAGIGNPQRFFDMLTQFGIRVQGHAFPDHHRFSAADLPPGPLMMTEKDAIKLPTPGRDDLWAVTVDARLSTAFFARLSQLLAAEGGRHA